ncbi:MAG: FAD-dependent oxidoreductase [Candidatus Helarchaeota archaeon]
MDEDVAIIGAGIGGIHCAIELKKLGFNPILIEKKQYIGGKSVIIGKCFPTQDCGSCISDDEYIIRSQGIRKCLFKYGQEESFPINYLINSKVLSISKKEKKFLIKIKKYPTFVNENCNNCGLCEEKCPITIDDIFNFKWSQKKVISIPFPTSVPYRRIIEREYCGNCKQECVDACPVNAINLSEKEIDIELEVKYVIISTGFEEFDVSEIKELGFGIFKNVITQLQLAKMLDPSGPTKGQIQKPSDWKPPKKILLALCTGSRDIRYKEYCSKICCSYAIKHAIESCNQNIQVFISYIDLRIQHEALSYLQEAIDKNVIFIPNKVAFIEEDPKTKQLHVFIENDNQNQSLNHYEMIFDLVVLTPALIPSNGIEFIERDLNIKIEENGFIHLNDLKPFEINSEIKNIFTLGCIDGLKNIPETIAQARAISYTILSMEKNNSW